MSVTFHALPPSANSSCVRCVLECGGIAHDEVNAYGQTRTPEYLAKFPTNLAPAIEHDGACVSAAAPGGGAAAVCVCERGFRGKACEHGDPYAS